MYSRSVSNLSDKAAKMLQSSQAPKTASDGLRSIRQRSAVFKVLMRDRYYKMRYEWLTAGLTNRVGAHTKAPALRRVIMCDNLPFTAFTIVEARGMSSASYGKSSVLTKNVVVFDDIGHALSERLAMHAP